MVVVFPRPFRPRRHTVSPAPISARGRAGSARRRRRCRWPPRPAAAGAGRRRSASPPGGTRVAPRRPRYASRTSGRHGSRPGGPSAMTRPRWSTATWCESVSTKSMSCSITTIVSRCGQPLDELAQRLHRPAPEPAGRLVEQEHLRLAGQRHADLEEPALAVGEVPRRDAARARRGRSAASIRPPGPSASAHGAGRRPAVEAPRAHGRHRHPDVLEHGVVVEEIEDLERPADSQPRPPVGRQAGDVRALEVGSRRASGGEEARSGG